ncbi:MAG: lycopene cyclase domain-containing protein [Cyclobacteriaceae bacterium]
MRSNYLYLAINFISIIVPFAFSFYPKANFSAKWRYLWPAILLTGIFFIIWDDWFTRMGVWGFNPYYVTGINLFNLPLEEVLFFVCIPYACVFTYEAINYFHKKPVLVRETRWITLFLIFSSFLMALIFRHRWYTFATFFLNGLVLSYLHFKVKPDYLGRFYFAFLFILIPFFVVNGILTGTGIESEVVWYNDQENLGIRLGTIPVEDTFYGMLLILMNVAIFEHLQKKEKGA